MSEIIEALNLLAKEKNLDKEEIMQGIEKAIASACEKDYGKNTQYSVNMDRETGEIRVYTHKTVVEQIMDPRTDITLEEAQQINPYFDIDDEVPVEITTMDFGRIATQKAKGIILQQIKEGLSDRVLLPVGFQEHFIPRGGPLILYCLEGIAQVPAHAHVFEEGHGFVVRNRLLTDKIHLRDDDLFSHSGGEQEHHCQCGTKQAQ